jgi:hypothetical protein
MAVPTLDSKLVPFSTNFNSRVSATPTVFDLTTAEASEYSALHEPYVAACEAVASPGAKSKALLAVRDAARAALLPYARELYAIVQASSEVTDANKLLLGITLRKQPQPSPAPGIAPGQDVVSVVGGDVTFHIHDSASSTRRGKPALVLGAKIYCFVGTSYPTDPGEWTYVGDTTKNAHVVTFPDSVAPGTQVWITSAWYNRKAETGPLAVPITTVLQFGLSQAA